MATAEGTGGDDPTRRSTPLPVRPSSEEKGKAIATESDEWSPTHSKKLRKGTGIVIVDHVVPDVPEAPTDSGSPKRERSALDSPGDGAPPFCG
ncbi:hypothetical protein L1049_022547 [Liquidambar formosana]|uniref:Uncharacterized protein n=1 Tax=Liquidambar formosana TaxID=63359 RepID=A0AAP0RE31_LIQFO